jgi:hypothetical protein
MTLLKSLKSLKLKLKSKRNKIFTNKSKRVKIFFKGGMFSQTSFIKLLLKIFMSSVAVMTFVPVVGARDPKYLTLRRVYMEHDVTDILTGLSKYKDQHLGLVAGNAKFAVITGIGEVIYGAIIGSAGGPVGASWGALAGLAQAGTTIMVTAVTTSIEQLLIIEKTGGMCSSRVECGTEFFIEFDNAVNGRNDNDIVEVLSYLLGYASGTPEGKAAAATSKRLREEEMEQHKRAMAMIEAYLDEQRELEREKERPVSPTFVIHPGALTPLQVRAERKSEKRLGPPPEPGFHVGSSKHGIPVTPRETPREAARERGREAAVEPGSEMFEQFEEPRGAKGKGEATRKPEPGSELFEQFEEPRGAKGKGEATRKPEPGSELFAQFETLGGSRSPNKHNIEIIVRIGHHTFIRNINCHLKSDVSKREKQLIKIRNNVMKQLLINIEALIIYIKIFKKLPKLPENGIPIINKHDKNYIDFKKLLKRKAFQTESDNEKLLKKRTTELVKSFGKELKKNFQSEK